MNKKIIYLGAGQAKHNEYDIVYQDINGKRDLAGDMLDVDLTNYDVIIATPPCNFWSRARGNRCSQYSLDTKHLLPDIIDKCVKLNKPFIIENTKNDKRMEEHHIIPRTDCFYFKLNRHIYFTNILFDYSNLEQRQDFKYGGKVIKYDDMDNLYHQGGYNVHNVIGKFLQEVTNNE